MVPHDDITNDVLNRVAQHPKLQQLHAAHALGLLRIVRFEDPHYTYDTLFGDTYNAQANPDIDPAQLKRERNAEVNRVRRDGVYGVIAQGRMLPSVEWMDIEDCAIWGFIGRDFLGSGHEGGYANAASAFVDAFVKPATLARLVESLR